MMTMMKMRTMEGGGVALGFGCRDCLGALRPQLAAED